MKDLQIKHSREVFVDNEQEISLVYGQDCNVFEASDNISEIIIDVGVTQQTKFSRLLKESRGVDDAVTMPIQI